MSAPLSRRLGLPDAVFIGLGAMVGAGVFAVFAPAAAAAGGGLLIGLGVAGFVAYCNATSSGRLAARYPESGGTYVYGRERLGPFWGYLAGWSFVVGKTASCAAMALTVGHYVWPAQAHLIAVVAVAMLTALNCAGVQRSALATKIIVALVLTVLIVVVAGVLTSPASDIGRAAVGADARPAGVLQAAGLLFFAFAGYARIATLGEEVRDPARTIPRAIPLALGIALAVYAGVAVALLSAIGGDALAAADAPVTAAVRAVGLTWLVPFVAVSAALAALGALLALILGVSRTTLAMARDRHFPQALAVVDTPSGVPRRAELAVGVVVAVVAGVADLRGAIGFSSFGVLVYYAVANASACTLERSRRVVPVLGLVGCLVLAFALPLGAVVIGAAVVVLGVLAYLVRSKLDS